MRAIVGAVVLLLLARLSGTQPAAGADVPLPAASDSVRYISQNGDDAHDGLSQGTALRTLQAAYASLPALGGTICALPGYYDVGAGWNLTRGKPVELIGLVKPQNYITSSHVVPLFPNAINAAVIYTSQGASSLVQTTGGTAANRMDGMKFENLVFELSNPATKVALDINSCNFGEVRHCLFYADKTTGPAAVDAQGVYIHQSPPGAYDGGDASWWTIADNVVGNMALCTCGADTGTLVNANQYIVENNRCLGLAHANTSTRPCIKMRGANRSFIGRNNVEAYHIGICLDSCWEVTEAGDGGEVVDYFIDAYNCKGLDLSPLGISDPSIALQSAVLVRGDQYTKAYIIKTPSAWTVWDGVHNVNLYNPTDDATHPALQMTSNDGIVLAPRNSSNQGVPWGAGGSGGASSVAAGSIVVAAKSADQTYNSNSTTLQNDSDLVLPLSGNTNDIWLVEYYLFVNTANATMDFKAALSVPAGVTGDLWYLNSGSGSFSTFGCQPTGGNGQTPAGLATPLPTGSTSGLWGFSIGARIFDGGTAGNVVLQCAQNTSDAGAIVVQKGSFLRATKVQ